jgi:hypothetical protein
VGRINMGRVLLGGLAAGLVINIGEYVLNDMVVAADMTAFLAKIGIADPGSSAIAWFVVFAFVLGIVMTWLYAAIRPRFGPGPKTALYAGLTVWFLAALYPTSFFLVLGMMPAGALVTGIIWELVEMPLAAIVGAWVYTES